MKSPIIEKIRPQVVEAILGALEYRGFYDAGKFLDDDIADALIPFFHSFALELAEGVEGKKKDTRLVKDQTYTTAQLGDVMADAGFNGGLDSAATFIREAVKTDEK